MGQASKVCPLCGRRESAHRTLRSRLPLAPDVGGQRWGLTPKGRALVAQLRADDALWNEQSQAPATSVCAFCQQPLDPMTPQDRAALGDVLLLCWDCWVETGGQPC